MSATRTKPDRAKIGHRRGYTAEDLAEAGDNPEWTDEDFARAQPFAKAFPELHAAWTRIRGPQKAPTKIPVSIRLSRDVVERFKAGGPGWQGRIDAALRKAAGLD